MQICKGIRSGQVLLQLMTFSFLPILSSVYGDRGRHIYNYITTGKYVLLCKY
jgi:hypothetical protein